MAIALQGHLAAISHLFPNLASAASPVLLRHSDAQHLARTLRKRILAREATPGEIYAGLALLQGLGRPEDIQSIEEYLAQGDDAKRSVAVRNSIAHMDQWSLAARRNPAASRIFLEELALAKKTLTQRRAGILDMEQLETDLGKLFDGTLARGARMEDSPAFAGNAAESRLPASGLKPYAPNSGAQRPAHGKIPFPTAAPILDLLNPSSFAAPENPLPGSQFTIMALMDLVEGSANYADYIRKLTTRFRVNSKGAFFALHGDRTVTPETPQLFLTIGNATIAYAPQMYTEIFWSEGDDTIQFQITEEPGGKLLINAYKFIFGQSGRMFKAKPEHVLTPEQVRRMHASELVGRTNKFAQEACASCHMNPRRRMVEPQNHTRRFVEDINWKFRDPAQHQLVKRKLASLFDRFANGPTRNNPLYRWLWEQPAVAARGGQIRPEDTFNYSQFISRMIETNSREMLAELKRSPRWGEYGEAFAAVGGAK